MLLIVATLVVGLFAGAAIYVSAVEHPARVSCGTALAIREFAPSYKRGAVMQATLATVGSVSAALAAWQWGDGLLLLAALLMGALIPFTLLVILPTNKRLLDSTLDPNSAEAAQLLARWGRLHAVRSVVSTIAFLILLLNAFHVTVLAAGAGPQQPAPVRSLSTERAPTRADVLRGEYGRYRANNDLLAYHLDIRVDPEKKSLAGKNTIRFKMIGDDTRIQLELYANLNVDKILFGASELTYARDINTVYVDFPETLKAGRVYSIDFHYSGTPREQGRFGGIAFRKDSAGRHWINTACEGEGSSIWWPSKDQWRDEPDEMDISVAVPNGLVDVSNGTFVAKTDLGDGYTRWDWHVHYPINSYNVSLNIGNYTQFSDRLDDLPLDFYVLPENLDKAKRQFAQAKPMLEAYRKFFGEYPFKRDGYKLIEVPYSGMEHQSAVTYGNRFANGYLERDWTGVGVSLKFDFIIIHESAHEWFGNAISAADTSDMWIHEGWATYLENLYVEHVFGYDDALKYVNGYKAKVRNEEPIITQRGIHRTPPGDQYFKGALFLNTLRSVVNDDARWWKLLREMYQQFKYRNIMTEDLVRFFNAQLGQDLTPIFDQYLRRAALPTLELAFNAAEGTVSYRWKADERAFAMPVRAGSPGNWEIIRPTTDWKTMRTSLSKDAFEVATDLYYVNVAKDERPTTAGAR